MKLELNNMLFNLESCGKDTFRLHFDDEDTEAADRSDLLEALAAMLGAAILTTPEYVRPVTVECTVYAAARAVAAAPGLADPAELFALFGKTLDDEEMATFLAHAIQWGDVETELPNKRLALAVAESFGPEMAQLLYRFAVLVTKLA
jgi:hypothetical protein